MTKFIVTFIDSNNMTVPKAEIQAGRVHTVQIMNVLPENRYEEIHVTLKLVGHNLKT